MTLTEKIELLIKRTQMSGSQFADLINIPRSSISHIVSGRNKPSLDVVQKILKTFPDISAEELLYEDRSLIYLKDQEFKKTTSIPAQTNKPSSPLPLEGLFKEHIVKPSESNEKLFVESSPVQEILRPIEKLEEKPVAISESPAISKPSIVNHVYGSHVGKHIERVVIFYTDGTFSESKPNS